MPTTELVILPMSAGNEKIGDPASKGAKVMGETVQTLLSTSGCQRVHLGNAIEDESSVRVLIDWDSLPQHKEFMASSEYGPFSDNIKSVVAGKPIVSHVDFKTHEDLDAALGAPVTELVAFYFDTEVPSTYGQGIEGVRQLFESVKGLKGLAWGTTHETNVEYNGVTGQAAVFAIGWDSVDAHMAFRETATFKDNIHLLRSTSKAALMQHIQAVRAHKD